MTVADLQQKLGLEALNLSDGAREVTGGYSGDLLSWVMGRAESGDAWVTIMTNLNVVAVASLCDVACVVFAEGVEVPADVLAAAARQEINLLKSRESAFSLCGAIRDALAGE